MLAYIHSFLFEEFWERNEISIVAKIIVVTFTINIYFIRCAKKGVKSDEGTIFLHQGQNAPPIIPIIIKKAV